MNILLGIPSSGLVRSSFALDNLPSIIAYTKAHCPDVNLSIAYQEGVRTDRNRNIILYEAINQGNIDAILWLDEDMLYPHHIVEEYLKVDADIIGCLYFKRAANYDPVGYRRGTNPKKPYIAIQPHEIPKDGVIEVDGLGYGGMFVKMSLYNKMGDDKWTHYGANFHLPFPSEGRLTHDLQFCEDAKKYGATILLHCGIRPGHISEKVVTEKDWIPLKSSPKSPSSPTIAVLCPSIDTNKAQQTMEQLKKSAGMEASFYIIEDKERTGYVKTVNTAVQKIDADYYVYTAEDAYGGKDWLKIGFEHLKKSGQELLAFNDGKWNGHLASFGLVSKQFLKAIYNGNLFYEGYHSHYGDTELTAIAMRNARFCHTPEALMIEVDPNKHGVNPKDKELYNQRKVELFGDEEYRWILEKFS
jgi:hypothetical protein